MEKKTWTQLWLDYKKTKTSEDLSFLTEIILHGFSEGHPVIQNTLSELQLGIGKILGAEPAVKPADECEGKADRGLVIIKDEELPEEGYKLKRTGQESVMLSASTEKGVLYGTFCLLRKLSLAEDLEDPDICTAPENPLRMLNHWDNMDGSIERGYSGRSFFFNNGEIIVNERTRDYARLIASIGINAVVINNVNVFGEATELITGRYAEPLRKMSEIFAGYGIRLFLSLNFASPIELGNLPSCDPLDPSVIRWWEEQMRTVFDNIPNLGGFLVKADSEGRPGPFTYGRNQAEGANMLAKVIKPYGGLVIWRCFVYNCRQDWRDRKTDRARAGYDNFHEMDGQFDENVILQIKNGPMDFQIREPVSPLFGGMLHTNEMLEVQIAQEYTGQQIDLCYLIPMFKEILSFRTYVKEQEDTVADIISGRTFGNRNTGIATVANTGDDSNWTGHDLAAANLYGFGRLAWDMNLTPEEIAKEWISQTYTLSPDAAKNVLWMLLHSREIYEDYTSPLGIGWMVNPSNHYGPSVNGYEYDRWGTYHRADHLGVGVDRTDKGTGYAQQYNEPNASMYNDPQTCPEELLLFFHRVLYRTRLKSGKTLIQHIYDSHFEGYEKAQELKKRWESIRDELPEDVYPRVLERLDRQISNAREWCDQVNSYFYRISGIEDEKGRTIY